MNFLYNNYFSDYEGYDEILSILYNTIHKELSQNSYDVSKFLNNTSLNHYFFSYLPLKKEIRNYLVFLLKDIVRDIASNDYSYSLDKKNLENIHIQHKIVNHNSDEENTLFYENVSSLGFEELKPIIFHTNDIRIKEYCDELLLLTADNNEILSANPFISSLYSCEDANEIVNVYQNLFLFIIKQFDILIERIKQNLDLIPKPIKYICKMISILLKQINKNIKDKDINNCISKFFFEELIETVIKNPNYTSILSFSQFDEVRNNNFQIFWNIFNHILTGKIFIKEEEQCYKIFNKYIVERREDIFFIVDKLIDIELPDFSQKREKKQYENRCIAYNNEILMILLTLIKENKHKITSMKNISEFLLKSIEVLTAEEHFKTIVNNYKKENSINFNEINILYIIDYPGIKENNEEKVISQLKEKIEYLLSNEIEIPNDLSIKIKDLKDIKLLGRQISIYNRTAENKKIRRVMCIIDSLIERLDNEYKTNYNKIIDEMITDTRIDIELLQDIIIEKEKGKKVMEQIIEDFKHQLKRYNKIEIVNKTKDFINNSEIYVEIKVDQTNNIEIIAMTEKEIKYYKKNKEAKKEKELKGKCSTIKDFIDNFPNFNEIFKNNIDEIIEHEKRIELSSKLASYYDIIKKVMINWSANKLENDTIYEGVINYILDSLSCKMYPKELNTIDKELSQKYISLSWIKSSHLAHNFPMNNEEIERYIKKINMIVKGRNPLKQIKIFDTIVNEIQSYEVDNILPTLIYIILRAKPKRLSSILDYCCIFSHNSIGLRTMNAVLYYLKHITYERLIGVSKESFQSNCENAIKENK